MVLDYEYGLKAEHNITEFDTYFRSIAYGERSLKDMLLSNDPIDSEKALYILTKNGLDDLHSNYCNPSAYAGIGCLNEMTSMPVGPANKHIFKELVMFREKRSEMLKDENGILPAYQEIGNTAYVAFDNFDSQTDNYYVNFPDKDSLKDTVGLLIYANSQIRRENSPIENVVIDLSCNTGGAEDAVAFVCSWFLRKANIYFSNSMTEASSVNTYSCDANLDHEFDEKDSVGHFFKYCVNLRNGV